MSAVPAGCPLTPRQLEIIEQVANGRTFGQIAHAGGRTESSVRSMMQAVRDKLQVPNATQAALRCVREGWIPVDGLLTAATFLAPEPRQSGRERLVIKPAYRVYLYAMDLFLAARTPDEKRAARAIMDRAAGEAGIPTGRPDTNPDLVELLVRHVRRERQARRTTARCEAP